MNRKITTIVLIILVILGIIAISFHATKKFYLDKEYYNDKGLTEIEYAEVKSLLDNKKTFILFVYNNFCQFSVPCENIFKETAIKNGIEIKQIPFQEFKKVDLYKKVKYSPSIIIIKNGKIVDYLNASKDEDIDKYQDSNEFESWLKKYVLFT